MEILTHLSILDGISLFMFMVETGLVYKEKAQWCSRRWCNVQSI